VHELLNRREHIVGVSFDLHRRPHSHDLAVRPDQEGTPLRRQPNDLASAVRVDNLLVGIGDERELETVRLDELPLPRALVGADSDDLCVQRIELRLPSLEVLRLVRSTGRVRARKEPDDGVPA
jgi:hypothetical protein